MPTNLPDPPKKLRIKGSTFIGIGVVLAAALMIYGAYAVRKEQPGTHDTSVIRPPN